MVQKRWIALAAIGLGLAYTATHIGAERHALYATPTPVSTTPMAFPPGFYWGAAIAAQQAESQQDTDWTAFERDAFQHQRFETGPAPGVAKPGHIHALGTSSATVRQQKTGFDSLMGQDMAMAQGMGLNAFRFSIEWARLFPKAGMTAPDPQGIAYYKRLLAEMKQRGITPFATLFHFSSPAWFFEPDANGKRGWERTDALTHWQQFVTAVADHFVPEIAQWCTLNEPMVYVYNGYMEGVFPPLERRGDVVQAAPVIEALLRAHVIGYRTLHQVADAKKASVNVGFTKHTRAFEPLRNWAPLDRLSAQAVDQAFKWDFNDAVASGRLKLTNTSIDKEIEGLKDSQDFVGINYYGRFYIQSDILNPTKPRVLQHDPDVPAEPINDLGWAIYPHGFYDILTQAHKRYAKPIFVLENGTADKADNDVARQKFLVAHVRELWLAMQQEKVDVRGYIDWSLFDNFEWAEGFTARFGLAKVDYENGFQRTERPSAAVYRSIAKANALSPQLAAQLGTP